MTRARWIDGAISLLLVACVFVAFRPALDAGFLDWDDDRNFVNNPAYRGLGAEQLGWMFTTFHMGPYQPLAWVTLGLDHELFGMDAAGYHRTSVLIHALAVVAFFFAARRLFGAVWPALSTAAMSTNGASNSLRSSLASVPLNTVTSSASNTATRTAAITLAAFFAAFAFGVHPLRAESVAWVTERRDVVSGLFAALTLYAWLRAVAGERRRAGWYALSLLAFLAALASKATVVGLPIALFVLDVWPLRRWRANRRRVWLDHVPFLVLSLVFAFVAVQGQASTGTALRGLSDYGLAQRAAQAAYSCVFYPWKTLLPSGLTPIYDMPSPFDPYAARFVFAAVVFVAVSAAAWVLRRRVPAFAAAWIAFLVLVAPVSGLVSTGPQLVADRYSYLSGWPVVLFVAGAVGLGFERAERSSRTYVIGGALLVCALLAWRTHAQTQPWRDMKSLWEHAYAVNRDSAVANQQLGVVRVKQSAEPGLSVEARARLLEEALGLYTRAYELAPHPNHVFNIGGLVMQRAELDPATRLEQLAVAAETFSEGMRFARETTGVLPQWRVMHASALVELGRRAEARTELELALQDSPTNVGALLWLARIDQEEGRPEDAIARLERCVALQPENATAWNALVKLVEQVGPPERAAALRARR